MFFLTRKRLTTTALAAVAATTLVVSGCSVGEIGGGGGDNTSGTDSAEISFLIGDSAQTAALADELIKGFTAKNPNIKVNLETQPSGTEGDNLVKTKLSTGEMSDVFLYNSGSLFQAINPDTNLTPLGDQEWVGKLDESFKPVVSTPNGLYGAPLGSTQAGAMLYNKKVYEKLGLKIPTSWAELDANNKKILAEGEGVAPIAQTYGETWTSQLFVLGDFANVLAQDPDWATEYTANKRKYVDEPGIQGFANQEASFKAGYFNKDFASASYDDGIKMLATAKVAHYPMLTSAISALTQNYPDNLNDVGVFALPAQDAADTNLTVWYPNALYIPKTTEGAKLDAAKKFIAYVQTEEGCAAQTKLSPPSGPYVNTVCTLPADAAPILTEAKKYFDEGKTHPALEFLSPIKGPNLESITVEVGSGIRDAKAGAALYDKDVQKQAQQLGLDGW